MVLGYPQSTHPIRNTPLEISHGEHDAYHAFREDAASCTRSRSHAFRITQGNLFCFWNGYEEKFERKKTSRLLGFACFHTHIVNMCHWSNTLCTCVHGVHDEVPPSRRFWTATEVNSYLRCRTQTVLPTSVKAADRAGLLCFLALVLRRGPREFSFCVFRLNFGRYPHFPLFLHQLAPLTQTNVWR